jgi:hypothetical protein
MKLLRIIVLAACAAYGAIIGGANLAQATPMNGLLPAAPVGLPVEHVQFPCVFPFNCGYGYYGPGYYGGGYYGRGYYGRHRYYGHRYYGHRYYGRRYR